MRTMRSCFETRMQKKLPADHVLTNWMALWAADIMNKCNVHVSGRTTHEIITHHKWRNPMISFGEVVIFKLATDKGKRHKLESEWSRGILVGMSGRTTEMIVATSEGVYKCRTVGRVPSEHMTDPEC